MSLFRGLRAGYRVWGLGFSGSADFVLATASPRPTSVGLKVWRPVWSGGFSEYGDYVFHRYYE